MRISSEVSSWLMQMNQAIFSGENDVDENLRISKDMRRKSLVLLFQKKINITFW